MKRLYWSRDTLRLEFYLIVTLQNLFPKIFGLKIYLLARINFILERICSRRNRLGPVF